MSRILAVVFLCALLAFPAVRADDDVEEDDYADTERAHLIVRKSFDVDFAVQGRNLTVQIEVYNAGQSSALAVELKDSALPGEVQLLEGDLTATFDKINVGERVTHTYVVTPLAGDTAVYFDPAKVSYKAELDAAEQQVGQSTRTGIYVLTAVQKIQQHAITVGQYISLGAMREPKDWRNFAIIVAVIGGLLGANQMVKSLNAARTKRTRQKALEALEKDE